MRALLVMLALLGACSSEGPDPLPDAGPGDDTGPSSNPDAMIPGGDDAAVTRMLEVGTGRDMFEPLIESQMVPMILGPQAGMGGGRMGGHHIWSGLRARGFEPRGVMVDFKILDINREVRASQGRMFNLELSADGAHVAYGIAPRIDDCCLIDNAEVYLRVELTDSTGATGSDERKVLAGACLDADSRSVCP